MGVIAIRALRAKTRIGVSDEERSELREVVVDLELETSLDRAGETDDLADTIDYSAVVSAVTEAIEGGEVRLLEHLAVKIANAIKRFSGVDRVTVEVSKKPPIAEVVEAVAVRISREFR
jgi:dihydroneopterin aldolase